MVLVIGGVRISEAPQDSRSLYRLVPSLKETGVRFANMTPKVIGPKELLYVSQREFAVCHPQDKNISILGVDECTTCMAVALRHPDSGAVALGHFEIVCVEGLSSMLTRLQEISGGYYSSRPILMHIVGSFSDSRGYSEELIQAILSFAISQPVELELVLACVGDVNTVMRGNIPCPILYGFGVDVKTGELFPATFSDKGPDLPLRMARIFTGSYDLLEVYEPANGLLRIGPFHYGPLRSADVLLQESDEFILNHLSSSPDVEPPNFVAQVKSTLRYILEHPFPGVTVFPHNRPRYFKKDEVGQWHLIEPEFSQNINAS